VPQDPVVPTTLTLTNQERRVIYTALTYASASLDAEGQAAKATIALELAYRILPGGLRDLENAA
jgi:hypothetical protein